jgi:hypothetical protein
MTNGTSFGDINILYNLSHIHKLSVCIMETVIPSLQPDVNT